MESPETLEEFYRRKFDWIPENLRNGMGHFNVFRLEPFVGEKARPVPYKRRDFFKIMLVRGSGRVHYADRIINIKQQALSFSNPLIPYKWEHTQNISGGIFCIFNRKFFNQFGNIEQYSVFQPQGTHIFELSDLQAMNIEAVFEKMLTEIESEYIHKYDSLRNLVFELLHIAMKMQPAANAERPQAGASRRISLLFLELLERQFPVDESHREIKLRTASDFASQLNIHVNHLNRAVKETANKTTSRIIADRLVLESKTMLKQSNWTVAEISNSLGFSEVTHFNNFFKKHTDLSPLKFRKT